MQRRVPPSVEPARSADEYIDDLPLRDKESANASTGKPSPNIQAQPIERVAYGPGTVLKWLCVVAVFMAGMATGTILHAQNDSEGRDAQTVLPPTVEPAPTVTVTEQVTRTRLPESCKRALDDMVKYLDAAAAVGDAHSRQLDIISESYVAILQRDWRALNKQQEAQRKLGRSIGPAASEVLPVLVEVEKGIDKCRSDAR